MFIDLGSITINTDHIISIKEELEEHNWVGKIDHTANRYTKYLIILKMDDQTEYKFGFDSEDDMSKAHYMLVHEIIKAEKLELNDENGGLDFWYLDK